MGKTALLRYFRQRINQDWGLTEFNGQFSALVVYVSFTSQVDRRYMEQLALSALVDICRSRVLESSKASLRLDQLTPEVAQQVITNPDGSKEYANLLDDEILDANGVDPALLNQQVAAKLLEEGVQGPSATAFAAGSFEDLLKSFRRGPQLGAPVCPKGHQDIGILARLSLHRRYREPSGPDDPQAPARVRQGVRALHGAAWLC